MVSNDINYPKCNHISPDGLQKYDRSFKVLLTNYG